MSDQISLTGWIVIALSIMVVVGLSMGLAWLIIDPDRDLRKWIALRVVRLFIRLGLVGDRSDGWG